LMVATRLGVAAEVPDAPWLNCDNAHIAALVQHFGWDAASEPMGCQWYFSFSPSVPVPTLTRIPVLDAVAQLTGQVYRRHQVPIERYADEMAEMLASGRPFIAYGDSYHMPWLPYFGWEASPHPFIIEGVEADGTVLIVEAYTNSTPKGKVIPGPARVTADDFGTLLRALPPDRAGEVITLESRREPAELDVIATLEANARAIVQSVRDGRELTAFAAQGRASVTDVAEMARFDLSCWEVMRARCCHSAWLARLAGRRPEIMPASLAREFETTIAESWRRASQFAFIGSQRLKRGSPVPSASFDLIEGALTDAETAFGEKLLGHVGLAGS
jgi:hypothetical protein